MAIGAHTGDRIGAEILYAKTRINSTVNQKLKFKTFSKRSRDHEQTLIKREKLAVAV